jgi:4-hydroxy-tetrahydrodipicolinate reductase
MIKVLVNGAKGKMGSTTVAAVTADPHLTLVGQTGRGDDLVRAIRESGAEAVVDFTTAEAGSENFKLIIEAGAHPVVGASGFNQGKVDELKVLCRQRTIGGLVAPNFSLGAVLMMKYAEHAARYMPHVEIVEAHHEQKLDAPSGTAIRTAEMISSAISANKGVANVRVHSIRLPGVLAQQRVIFGSAGETLSIEHNSLNRESFMAGVCLAARKIIGTTELFYGLDDLLFRDGQFFL